MPLDDTSVAVVAAQTFARDAASGVLPLAAQLFQLQGCTPERMQRDMAHHMQTSLRMKDEVSRIGHVVERAKTGSR